LYIKKDQLEWVFRHDDVGTGQKNFRTMEMPGDFVFVLSMSDDGLTIFGEIPVAENYVDNEYRHGWRYRVRAVKGGAVQYPTPVLLEGLRDHLSILKDVERVWPA